MPYNSITAEAPGRSPLTPGESGPMDVGVLFVDLVDSSVFASVLGLREYADYLASFHQVCLSQCRHFFDTFLEGHYREGVHYRARMLGDELLVYLHTGKSHNDVYLLTCLAAVLKAAWLVSPVNLDRLKQRTPVGEISAGIHHGPVWAVAGETGFEFAGFAINLAKRVESHSRTGRHYRVFLSDQAFKQVHFRQRNLIFAPGVKFEPKGIFGQIICHELAHSFLNPVPRMTPEAARLVHGRAQDLIHPAFQDLWIHDMFQVWSEHEHNGVTDGCMELCQRVLHQSPGNPVALYHLSQAYRERGRFEEAGLLLSDLCTAWPQFADGHLDRARVLSKSGDLNGAAISLLRARILGLDDPLEG